MFCPARPYFLSPDSPFQNPPAIGSYWLVPHILVLLSAEKENESRLFFWILLSVLLCQLCSILQTCLSSKMGMFPFATKPCQCHFHTGRVRTAANKENMQNSCRTAWNQLHRNKELKLHKVWEHQLQFLSGCRLGASLIQFFFLVYPTIAETQQKTQPQPNYHIYTKQNSNTTRRTVSNW